MRSRKLQQPEKEVNILKQVHNTTRDQVERKRVCSPSDSNTSLVMIMAAITRYARFGGQARGVPRVELFVIKSF
uniref:Uncharacterized protein n=1 Tax=Caenorhabditis tropicalis TaxID=1561998 RepID=A0A1I7U589_9PELO